VKQIRVAVIVHRGRHYAAARTNLAFGVHSKSRVSESEITKRSKVSHHRLLVAEDDRALRELLVDTLKTDGYEIVPVANGADLSAALSNKERPFDLVISDVRMPGASGLDVLSRSEESASLPPVVLITAFGDDEIHAKARELGALAVLDKPIDMDDLREYVSRVLSDSNGDI
jgi:DNA-binding NtrC family response regulator